MVEPDVAQALRTGPFAVALDVAIEASGLTLERITARLAERGVLLSRATLSYWRSGRSRPERVGSLAALPVLEELLGVPAGSFSALLRPRDGEPQWPHRPPGSGSRRRLWPTRPGVLAEVDAPPDGQFEFLAVDDVFVVQDAATRLLRVRMVTRALRDGVGRLVVFYQANHGDGPAPQWTGLSHCRLGRVRTDGRVSVAELILNRRLAAGELTVLEYELRFAVNDDATDFYYRTFTRPCRLWTCQVTFAGQVPPRVFRFRRRHLDDDSREIAELWLGDSRTALTVLENVRPGIVGVSWES
ncbi:transcriptional regulator with XRE-family HTH domain [Allocatelliglobosispora scoriae]|uniref:Transcriptional regulator with XRE-family HTH domain n=1 Tax=Allocatelliglobosispora scoriae TaxID=643052 RepID=A0A841BLD5_9ACTN|nr:XRE family transcriptional regulator [Allocatelliglobosispora scoriae]MBB5868178.1 transcriptional regulator with XRE-family HTH domain [Allocatelliglobosispora scoriae]